jgi:hypothetical protein
MDALHAGDPARVGSFELLGRLGAGGMGQVYLGRDRQGRHAAVKVIHPGHAADPDFRKRFAREIATARRVDSPWTAAVLDADPHAPQPWLATAYVPGSDLGAVVGASGPLPEPAVVVLASGLARALAHLHGAGVVHRDIKPSNILLAADGPRLIDFGIARAADATKITHTGMVVGTPAYMSPEQARGDESGPPGDVFSFAAVVVYAATGTGPFGTASHPVAMLRRVMDDEPDLSRLPAALRPHLEPCFAKDPAARPSAAVLAARLATLDPRHAPPATLAPGAPVFGAPTIVTQAAAAPAKRRRRPRVLIGLAAAAVALAAGSGVALAGGAGAPGWSAAVSTSRNAAYDVPPPWTADDAGRTRGYRSKFGSAGLLSGTAVYQADAPSPCPGEDRYTLAWSGITGSASPDPAAAARNTAKAWIPYFEPAEGDGSPYADTRHLLQPRMTYRTPRPVTVNGQGGSHLTADVTVSPEKCGSRRKVMHVVAVPDGAGASLVWVLFAEQDVPGALTDADVDAIVATLRPAGLEHECAPEIRAVGSWC